MSFRPLPPLPAPLTRTSAQTNETEQPRTISWRRGVRQCVLHENVLRKELQQLQNAQESLERISLQHEILRQYNDAVVSIRQELQLLRSLLALYVRQKKAELTKAQKEVADTANKAW